ncbi:MAG: hypothetical protein E6K66_10750 [Nitrospirae bacterium]|nr:MAG: hypothetical protein E6K66_10750 [Nitrospirota bacterium]
MSICSANMPFRFVSCMELREVLGKRAMDEHRLLELIEEVPADSIYYHTHSYFLRHAYTQQLYSNDFATWVVLYAQDRVLGERLGVLDPFDFSDIEQLRDEILRILADHLNHSTVPRFIVSEPFEFIRSHIIEVPLGLEARTLSEFYDALADVEVGAVYNHVCEARMRKRLQSVDFSCWLSSGEGLGLQQLALNVEQVGRLGLSLEGMRSKILRLCDQELARQRTL